MAEQVGERSVVVDGELVAHQGTPANFYRVGGRMATGRPSPHSAVPLTFVEFDVLWLGGDVTGCDHRTRRRLLESLNLSGPSWCTSSSYLGSGTDLFAACARLGLESVVAKRLDGHYYPGQRRGVWIKAKCPECWRAMPVTGDCGDRVVALPRRMHNLDPSTSASSAPARA